MSVESALTRSENVSNWIDMSIHGLEIPSGDRETMAGALLDQVHEHHKAIQLLIKQSFLGSAFSLERLIFETYVRGLWLWRCASEKEIADFARDKMPQKSVGKLIQEIEAVPGYERGVLTKFRKEAWSVMNSYTHGGIHQVGPRIIPDAITANYPEGVILEAINFSRTIALLAAFEIFSWRNATI